MLNIFLVIDFTFSFSFRSLKGERNEMQLHIYKICAEMKCINFYYSLSFVDK